MVGAPGRRRPPDAPPGLEPTHRAPTAREIGTSCNWCWRLSYHKPSTWRATDTVGPDLGPSSIAIVPREAEARLEPLCAELCPDARAIRRLQRRMERQRRAANLEHYDERVGPPSAEALPVEAK